MYYKTYQIFLRFWSFWFYITFHSFTNCTIWCQKCAYLLLTRYKRSCFWNFPVWMISVMVLHFVEILLNGLSHNQSLVKENVESAINQKLKVQFLLKYLSTNISRIYRTKNCINHKSEKTHARQCMILYYDIIAFITYGVTTEKTKPYFINFCPYCSFLWGSELSSYKIE